MPLTRFFSGVLVAVCAAASAPAFAAESPTRLFDGVWDVTLTCPPHHEDDDAKGYVHRFAAEVKDDVLRGTHGTEGQPSWHLLSGTIAPEGNASLRLDGVVNNAGIAVNNASRGKAYSYRVRATFQRDSGIGQRVGKRKCDFRFARR